METLLKKLAVVKGRTLTKRDTCWLHLLLYGLTPQEIAQELYISPQSIRPELGRGIYQDISVLTSKTVNHFSQVRVYLEEYRKKEYIIVLPPGVQLEERRIQEIREKLGIKGLLTVIHL